MESRSLQSHLSIPAVTITFLLLPPLIMPSDKAAGSLVISCVKQSPRGKLLAAFNVKTGIVTNHFAGSLQSNSYSSLCYRTSWKINTVCTLWPLILSQQGKQKRRQPGLLHEGKATTRDSKWQEGAPESCRKPGWVHQHWVPSPPQCHLWRQKKPEGT